MRRDSATTQRNSVSPTTPPWNSTRQVEVVRMRHDEAANRYAVVAQNAVAEPESLVQHTPQDFRPDVGSVAVAARQQRVPRGIEQRAAARAARTSARAAPHAASSNARGHSGKSGMRGSRTTRIPTRCVRPEKATATARNTATTAATARHDAERVSVSHASAQTSETPKHSAARIVGVELAEAIESAVGRRIREDT